MDETEARTWYAALPEDVRGSLRELAPDKRVPSDLAGAVGAGAVALTSGWSDGGGGYADVSVTFVLEDWPFYVILEDASVAPGDAASGPADPDADAAGRRHREITAALAEHARTLGKEATGAP